MVQLIFRPIFFSEFWQAKAQINYWLWWPYNKREASEIIFWWQRIKNSECMYFADSLIQLWIQLKQQIFNADQKFQIINWYLVEKSLSEPFKINLCEKRFSLFNSISGKIYSISTRSSNFIISLHKVRLCPGPALSRCNQCGCIGSRASGGPALWWLGRLFIFAIYSLRTRIV